MAEAQLQDHDVLIYRNPKLITPGVLLTRTDFEAAHPEVVKQVLQAYAKARAWAVANPKDTAAILAKESNLPLDVAELQLSRSHLAGEAITPADQEAILGAGPILQTSGKLSAGADLPAAEKGLFNTSFTTGLGLK
jgi:sulfonate transport system substrate-binding protein